MTDDADQPDDLQSYSPEARARALQSLLTEADLLSPDAVDQVVARYEQDVGPMVGKRVVARAWTDPAFKRRLLDDGLAAVAQLEPEVGEGDMELRVVENDPDTHHLVVCTLCSCYPWAVLGLPPTWYKTPAYRSRAVDEPRAMLAEEFDTHLGEGLTVNVWDSNSEIRYMVLPQRPPGTEGLAEADLREHVSRNAMVGVERLA